MDPQREKTETEDEDLEDGEIDDDDDDDGIMQQQTKLKKPQDIPKTVEPSKVRTRPNIVEDDFAGNIEIALAMALRKDGIKPNMTLNKIEPTAENKDSVSERRSVSKRKKRDDRSRKKRKKYEDLQMNDGGTEDDEGDDDYEFLCVRGASPPIQSSSSTATTTTTINTNPNHRVGIDSYDSDYSNSSYDSYSSNDHLRSRNLGPYDDRRLMRRSSRERGGGRDRRINLPKRGGDQNTSNKLHGMNHKRSGGGGRNNKYNARDESDDDRQPLQQQSRKMEICKFYLMDCCAKREKCLYMHADFPCKFYYLGMRCVPHEKDACKFSHGKPLTDNLRAILLKHLETAPKEILGDFPRLNRENAIKLIDNQNQKLMVEYGMMVPPAIVVPTNLVSQAIISGGVEAGGSVDVNAAVPPKIPSLLDMTIVRPSHESDHLSMLMVGNNKGGKPRRSRWCDAPPTSQPQIIGMKQIPPPSLLLMQQPPPPIQNVSNQLAVNTPASSTTITCLKFLTGVLPADQIDKLEQLGIDDLDQLNQLTVAQLNDIGLTVDQIKAIQLNAINLKKLGIPLTGTVTPLTNTSTTIQSNVTGTLLMTGMSNIIHNQTPPQQIFGDLDMRISSTSSSITASTAINDPIPIVSTAGCSLDVDMRVLPVTAKKDDRILPPPATNEFDKFMTTPVTTTIDYSKYLKDSNLENILESNDDQLGLDGNGCDIRNDSTDDEDENSLKINIEPLATEDDPPSHTSTKHEIDDERSSQDVDERSPQYVDERSPQDVDERSSQDQDDRFLDRDDRNIFFTASKRENDYTVPLSMISCANDRDDRDLPDEAILNQPASTNFYRDPRREISSASTPLLTPSTFEYYSKSTTGISNTNTGLQNSRLSSSHSNQLNYTQNGDGNYNENIDNDHYDDIVNDDGDQHPKVATVPAVVPEDKVDNVRSTIYDCLLMNEGFVDGDIDDRDVIGLSSMKPDRDMRLNSFVGQNSIDSENGDVDLRLPFKSVMANYVPATEIDASITSHSPMEFKLVEIHIPQPDYRDIRRSFPTPKRTSDPRLRRIFALKVNDIDENGSDDLNDPFSGTTTNNQSLRQMSALSVASPPQPARIDPRRKREQENTVSLGMLSSPSPTTGLGTTNANRGAAAALDIQFVLQKSMWYRDLSSKQKINVNQHLATLTADLKKFQQNPNTDKPFETTSAIQQILTNLGVHCDEHGHFIEYPLSTNETGMSRVGGAAGTGTSLISTAPPNMNMMSMMLNQQPSMVGVQPRMPFPPPNMASPFPPNFPPGGDNRPGLLGIAPNIPFNINFQQFEDYMESRFSNECGAVGNFGNQLNTRMRGSNNFSNTRGGRGATGMQDRWRNNNQLGGGSSGGVGQNRLNQQSRRNNYDRGDSRRHE